MKRFKNSLIAAVMGVVMGMTLIGSTVAYADEPCNHTYGIRETRNCYYSSTVGSHNYNGNICYIIIYYYHNHVFCNYCGEQINTYDSTETVHTLH